MDRELSLVVLGCRLADHAGTHAEGARRLGAALGERLGVEPRAVGRYAARERTGWERDLEVERGCLLEAGGQVADALAAGRRPLLAATDCTVAATTLRALHAARPEAKVLWLDAHGDLNTPRTSPSGYLGGMPLAAALGVWDPGLGDEPPLPADRVVLCGVRDLDPGEEALVAERGIACFGPGSTERSAAVEALGDAPVFVHLDADVLDPSVAPASYPAPGGLLPDELADLLLTVRDRGEVVGLEVTALLAPGDDDEAERVVRTVAGVVEHLL